MIAALVIIPFVSGLVSFFVRPDLLRRGILLGAAIAHGALTGATWLRHPAPTMSGWLGVDPIGQVFLTVMSLLFAFAAAYACAFLADAGGEHRTDFEEGFRFSNVREARFTGCLLLFLSAMTLVTVSQHLGLLWAAIESTTLASAPLIYFHRHHRSLEAAWKYLLICSVGIALALLGNFFLAVAVSDGGHAQVSLLLSDLLNPTGSLHPAWLRAAFLLFLVGYGTKMGLAPFHTWLPDAHSEAPSVVSALLSGALLNCAFLGILRALQVCGARGLAEFGQHLLLMFGLFSMAIAAVFIVGQRDYKRMLAYSSVEHMGVLAVGVGLGGAAAYGAMFHVINHSLTKAMLFLVAGNILAAYHSKRGADVSGLAHALPVTGLLWMAGFLAITGSPPFGIFVSEFIILKAAIDQGHVLVAIMYLALLAIIMAAMARLVLAMVQGHPPDKLPTQQNPRRLTLTLVPAALCAIGFGIGVYLPPVVTRLLQQAAHALG